MHPLPPPRSLGRGPAVSPLGLGTGPLGSDRLSERDAERLLNQALDLGINLLDTARSYGLAESRIGLHLAHRRSEFVISTKGGYGVEGVPDWTGQAITLGIHRALRMLRTERVDVFHLHSCPEPLLAQDEIVQALEDAVREGKVGQIGYSGDNAPLLAALATNRFGVIETSVNLVDQRSLAVAVPQAIERGLGVIAKRPMLSGGWRGEEPPEAADVAIYFKRLKRYPRWSWDLPPDELALRFTAFAPGVTCAIVGTASPEHLARNAELVARGPLPPEVVAEVTGAFAAQGAHWPGVV